jgi:hypothetical protein
VQGNTVSLMAEFLLSILGIIILFTVNISGEFWPDQCSELHRRGFYCDIRPPEVEGRSFCIYSISFITLSLTVHKGCRTYHLPSDLKVVQLPTKRESWDRKNMNEEWLCCWGPAAVYQNDRSHNSFCGFHMVLTLNSNNISKAILTGGLSNIDALCSPWGTNWFVKYAKRCSPHFW